MSTLVCSPQLAVVVIGRNEGARLHTCLESLTQGTAGTTGTVSVVYVDSGSTDNSVAVAQNMGCRVINLDMQTPFTAARARNEGFEHVMQLAPETAYVQFVDGDCEILAGWLDAAVGFLDANPGVAVVSGRLRERFPEASIYNALCDTEWDTPLGESRACGGIAMMRAKALVAVNGFRTSLIAGEEPELCVRLRAAGWRIWRMDQEMALHDAAMLHFSQWWNRSKRAGFAFAEGAALHGAPPERHWVRESRSAWFWGLAIPVAVAGLSLSMSPWALILLLIYPVQVLRLFYRAHHLSAKAWWRAAFLVLGKFPEMLGQLQFTSGRLVGKRSRLIEYK